MLNSLSAAKTVASLKAYVQRSMSASPVQKLLLLSNLLLALVMAALFVAMVMLLINDKPAAKAISRTPAGAVASLRWAGFNNTAAVAPIEEKLDLNDLADANVKAKLLGVVLSERISSATIAFNGRPEQVYHIGDKLGSAVVIKQIQPFRIIVEQNGARRQIQLEKADSLIKTEQTRGSVETKDSGQKAADEGFAMANMFGALPVRAGKYGRGFKLNKLSR